jgi:hypothetical protein
MNSPWRIAVFPLLLLVGVLALPAMAIDDLREAEMSIEPEPEIGKAIYTFRFLPAKTQVVDKLVFECVYRQVFIVENSRGEKFEKIHEPEVFKYERKQEKFVDELDLYLNFRVPTSRERIVQTFGKNIFNEQAEIVIDRIRVTATVGGKKAWQMDFREGFLYRHDPASGEWKAEAK